MAFAKRAGPNGDITESSCHICVNKDAVWRHKHWLSYDGELSTHLHDNGFADERITGILHWVHSMRDRYGGMVDERGTPLSVWEARREQLTQYEKTYASTPEPLGPVGRKVAYRSFTYLLKAANTEHAAGWLEMCTGQFDEATVHEETRWTDFRRFVAEYERSSQDPDNAAYLERVPTQPVVQMAGGTR